MNSIDFRSYISKSANLYIAAFYKVSARADICNRDDIVAKVDYKVLLII